VLLCLSEADWSCIEKLIDVLGPLKEATLMVSKSNDAMGIGNVLGIYHACTTLLEASVENFEEDEAIVEGIKFAIEKLNHYYDNMSPVCGIAVMLNPSLKKQFLRSNLNWTSDWVKTVEDSLLETYTFYKDKRRSEMADDQIVKENLSGESIVGKYLKRKRTATIMETEYDRY
jgi:hypothetical protein